MAISRSSPAFVVVSCCLFFKFLTVVELIAVPDLRRTGNNGTLGSFVVPRSLLEVELDRLGLIGKVQLLTSTKYKSDCEGEVSLLVQTTVDLTMLQELRPELLDYVTGEGIFVALALPIVASDGAHAFIMLAYFTDVSVPFLSPYLTSVQAVRYVESITIGDGFVTLRNGCDVMDILFDYEEGCHNDADVGGYIGHVMGNDSRLTNFPARFDWGCDTILNRDVSFCKRLEPFADAINDANGDVCTEMATQYSKGCSARVRVEKMTGVFRDALPFFADMVPVQSFEAKYVEREHGIGIVFPCF